MAWLSLQLAVDGDRAEDWSDALLAAGALAVSIEDRDQGTDREEPQFGEPGQASGKRGSGAGHDVASPRAWKRNWLHVLLPAEAEVAAVLAAAGIPSDVQYESETVAEQDWVRLTQAQFEPIAISDGLWIVPSWHESPDPEAIAIVLDPGLAFGTGSHPTTRLCLRWLAAHLAPGERVLDYGCGSGILAIAAARLGAAEVVGVDIDAQAVESASANAERNGVVARFLLPEQLPPGDASFDVVLANILTNPLRALMPVLATRVRTGGRLVLSGILEAQAGELLGVYGERFDMRQWAADDGWVCLEGRKRC